MLSKEKIEFNTSRIHSICQDNKIKIDFFIFLWNIGIHLKFKRFFLAWLQNGLIYARFKLVLSHTEKLCIASYNKQFSTNI